MGSKKTKMYSALRLLIMMIISAAPAMADSIIQTRTFSGTPNYTNILAFDKFNDQTGTRILQSIGVSIAISTDNGHLILDNDGEEDATGAFEFGASANISSTYVALINSGLQPVTAKIEAIHSGTFDLAPNIGDGLNDFDPTAPDGMQYIGGVESDSDSGFIAPVVFWQYIGTGTFNIELVVVQWQNFEGAGGVEWAVAPVSAEGDVTIVYNYDVVPEPATMGLLALGGLLIRRKRK